MLKYQFGEDIPLAEPSWYQTLNTPYYKETHKKWRATLRSFTEVFVDKKKDSKKFMVDVDD